MDDNTKNMFASVGAGIAKKLLLGFGASLVTHGVIAGNQVETFASIGMTLVVAGWSLWNDYGKAIVMSQLEVLKAKSLAQAEKMQINGVKQVTAEEIAAQSPKLTEASVQKTAATLPASIQDNIAPAKVAVILLAIGLAFLLTAAPSSAQGLLKLPLARAPAPATTAAAGLQKIMDDIANVKQELVDGAIADIEAADADASSVDANTGKMRDLIAHTCYPAEIQFLKSLPTATAPTGKFVIVQMFQKKRDFVMLIQAGLPDYLKIGCAPLLGDEVQILTKTLGLIGVKAALGALVPGGGLLAGLTF